ncbi:hypothetical protein BDW02DRAFT_34595 [Decorospora gaudefroyi]|uniref:Uncharacterized protein n=1 Tax=Decorospora gaudefroyi TaxID=184978 RepID=A0A6A5KQ15_9PLEO|nr:hypothetical protein BDW02DRAFT_34595 [Decorospora gaudefroyi]
MCLMCAKLALRWPSYPWLVKLRKYPLTSVSWPQIAPAPAGRRGAYPPLKLTLRSAPGQGRLAIRARSAQTNQPAAVMDEYEEAILFTFSLLESRLDRLEYVLGASQESIKEKPKTAIDRIHRIEQSLQQLAGKTALLDEANNLLNKHKDVLKPQDDSHHDSPALNSTQKTALVVERATSFATTASQLQALEDQQIPTTDGFTKLAVLRPRIAEAEARQLQQALSISELRRRNGLVNQRYKQVMFLGAGRCWVDYNERLTKALRALVREEYRRRPDREMGLEGEEEEQEEEEEEEEENTDDDEL